MIPRLHKHQVPNPDSNLDHNLHGRGGLSPDLNPLCLRVNATSLDQDLDQNARVNGAKEHNKVIPLVGTDYIGGRENKVMPAQKLGLRNQIAIASYN